MIKDMAINEFLEALSSKQPTPGGGGASALAGAQGAALGEMVINLTLGKKKYINVESQMRELLDKLEFLKAEFLRLAEEDANVFAPLAAAYGMPAETEEEKAHKEEIMEGRLLAATLVPITVMERSMEALEIMEVLADKGSRMAVSDVGVGALMIRAGLLGAVMNVMINTKSMKNHEKAGELNQYSAKLKEQGVEKADGIYRKVTAELT